jgi:hypothetical protein
VLALKIFTFLILLHRLHLSESILFTWLRSLPESKNSFVPELIAKLDGGRNLEPEMATSDVDLCSFSSYSDLSPPGLRVWHSLLHVYSLRGAWKEATAILQFLKSSPSSQPDSVVYHRVISALCYSHDLSSFSLAMDYYTEMKAVGITPHPLSLAALLKCLSNWSREGVAYVDSLTQISDLICSTCIQLSQMTDDQFAELYFPKQHSEVATEEQDPFYFEALDSRTRDRQQTIDEILTQLMVSLACDRGLTMFAHSLKDHLHSHGVAIPNEGVEALIQVAPLSLFPL